MMAKGYARGCPVRVAAEDYYKLLWEAWRTMGFSGFGGIDPGSRYAFKFMGYEIMPIWETATTKSAMLEAIALARKNHPDLFGEKNG